MTRRTWLPLGLAAALALAVSPLAGQEELFEQGNQLYQAEDFLGAVEAYEAVRSAGFRSPELHYNLGNAYFKSRQPGSRHPRVGTGLEPGPERGRMHSRTWSWPRSLTADVIDPLPTVLATVGRLAVGHLAPRWAARAPRRGGLGRRLRRPRRPRLDEAGRTESGGGVARGIRGDGAAGLRFDPGCAGARHRPTGAGRHSRRGSCPYGQRRLRMTI